VSLTRADVEKVSLLARLQLTADELDAMTVQLGEIMGYVAQLGELDTRDVEPMAHAMDLVNVFADDTRLPSLDREQALANAPKRDRECYRVPAVLGDESSL
jgi:aspartyl-tRNA(Asn)/glutamyl-tRNA(Gln) amidotransferase subunit C